MNNVDLIYRSVAEDALTMLGAQLPESKTKAVARCVMEIHQLPSADALPVRSGSMIQPTLVGMPAASAERGMKTCRAYVCHARYWKSLRVRNTARSVERR